MIFCWGCCYQVAGIKAAAEKPDMKNLQNSWSSVYENRGVWSHSGYVDSKYTAVNCLFCPSVNQWKWENTRGEFLCPVSLIERCILHIFGYILNLKRVSHHFDSYLLMNITVAFLKRSRIWLIEMSFSVGELLLVVVFWC